MKRQLLSLLAITLMLPAALSAQTVKQDDAVRTGKLKNGLTYYIRHNAKEPGLADFYIAQRVGSILEEPRQRGLAHFLEHMAFNGTKHFPGKGKRLGIVPWCESIGVKFGANLNAYTSVDQTVYHIGAAPIGREGIVDSCLLVLNDWSHYILLEDKEIDKERGVIREEWRNRRSGMAMQRLMERVMPKIYRGSKYEDCMPIGNMDIVSNFPYQDLRDYYDKWYRPDLQAVIVVGDIDVDRMEAKIKRLFGKISAAKNPAERIYYPVNSSDRMIVAIEKDREQPIALGHLYMKRAATPRAEKITMDYQRDGYMEGLIVSMLNSRLADKGKETANPPYMSSTVRDGMFFVSGTSDAFSLSISCKQDNILGGIAAAVAEVERVRQHGFTADELERAKAIYLNAAQRRMKMEGDRRNSSLVKQCVNNFLDGEPILSPAYSYELMQKMDQEVTLKDINSHIATIITDRNQVFVLYGPDRKEVLLPSEAEIEETIVEAQRRQYDAHVDAHTATAIMDKMPAPGTIVKEEATGKWGMTRLTLSNRMEVYVKPTDYQADVVTMTVKGEGGTSLYPDADIANFALLASAITEGGVGSMTSTQLRKALTGKSVKVAPSIGQSSQRITATSSVKDLETMLQLTYLYFTAPRRDSVAFEGLRNRTRSFLTNRSASPKVVYNDSLNAVLYGNNLRTAPATRQMIDRADYGRIMEIYRERFADASAFKTVIIGNVSIDSLRPLLCRYLAALPATHKGEKADKSRLPRMVKENKVVKFGRKMAMPVTQVNIMYTADIDFSPRADLTLDIMQRCLQIAYTDSVREDKGGTYGIGVSFELDKDEEPNALLRISYKTDPTRYDELNPIVYRQLQHMATDGPIASSMDKVKQYLKKQYAQNAMTNDYWSYIIWHQIDDEADFDTGYCQMVDSITAHDVQQMAQTLLKQNHRIEVTMCSE